MNSLFCAVLAGMLIGSQNTQPSFSFIEQTSLRSLWTTWPSPTGSPRFCKTMWGHTEKGLPSSSWVNPAHTKP